MTGNTKNSSAVRRFGLLTVLATFPILFHYAGWFGVPAWAAVAGHLLQAVGILGMVFGDRKTTQE